MVGYIVEMARKEIIWYNLSQSLGSELWCILIEDWVLALYNIFKKRKKTLRILYD